MCRFLRHIFVNGGHFALFCRITGKGGNANAKIF